MDIRDPLDFINDDNENQQQLQIRRDPQEIADSIHSFTAESDQLLTELLHHRVLANDFERRLRELEYWHQQRQDAATSEGQQSESLKSGNASSSSANVGVDSAMDTGTAGEQALLVVGAGMDTDTGRNVKTDISTPAGHQLAHEKLEYENQLMKNLVVESINKQAIMHDKMEKVISLLCKVYSSSGLAGTMSSGLKAQLNSIIPPSAADMESSPTAISSALKTTNCALLLDNCPSGAAVVGSSSSSDAVGPPLHHVGMDTGSSSIGTAANEPLGIQIPANDAQAGPGTALMRQGSISKMSDENFYNLCDFLQLDTPHNRTQLVDGGEDASVGTVIGGQLLSSQPSLPSFAMESSTPRGEQITGGGALQKRYSSFENSINRNITSPALSRQDSINNNSVLSAGGPEKHKGKLTFDPHMPSLLPPRLAPIKNRTSSINDIDDDSTSDSHSAVGGIGFGSQGNSRSGSVGSRSSSINAPDDSSVADHGSVHSRDSEDPSQLPVPKRMRWDPSLTTILSSTPGSVKDIVEDDAVSSDLHPEKVEKIGKSQEQTISRLDSLEQNINKFWNGLQTPEEEENDKEDHGSDYDDDGDDDEHEEEEEQEEENTN